jgi:2-haloacid dehalogenase
MTKAIIFDLGNVLVDWNPMYVFGDYFETPEKRDYFLSEICSLDWNEEQDAGRSIVEATQLKVKEHPEWEQAIRDYYGRWTEMLRGPIPGSVEILKELKEQGRFKLYALTNWGAGLFDIALVRYNFLHWFDGRVVSGEERMRKPAPQFYQVLFDRYGLKAEESVFIDDNLRNINAARAMGIDSIVFQNPAQLKQELKNRNLL